MKRLSWHHASSEAIRAAFQEDGCVILTNAVVPDHVWSMQDDLRTLIEVLCKRHLSFTRPPSLGNHFDAGLIELARDDDRYRRGLYDTIRSLPSLQYFAVQTAFMEMARAVGLVMPLMSAVQFKMNLPDEGEWIGPPHQELNGARSPNMVFFLTPLVDITEEQGAVMVAPGSHKLGPLLHQPDPRTAGRANRYLVLPPESYAGYELEQVPMTVGETLLVNMYTVHAGVVNRSTRTRWQVSCRVDDAMTMPLLDGNETFTFPVNMEVEHTMPHAE